jgi:hypothetical protein
MELNETLVKVDQTLDSTTKKLEKLARETANKDIFVEVVEGHAKKQSKPTSWKSLLS